MPASSRRFRQILFAGTALTLAAWDSGASAQAVNNLSGSTNMPIASGQTLADTQTAPTTYSGVLSGAGAFSETGSSTLTLTNNNTFTGGTTINSGTLTSGVNGALASTGSLAVGGTFDLNGYTQTVNGLSGTGTIQLSRAGSGGSLTVNLPGYQTFAGNIVDGTGAGAGSLTIDGSYDFLTLTGNNTYTGGTTITDFHGLTIGSATALAGTSVTNDGELDIGLGGGSGTFAQTISGSGRVAITSGTVSLTGSDSFSGYLDVDGGTLQTATSNLQSAQFTNVEGTLNLTDAGTSTVGATFDNFGTVGLTGGGNIAFTNAGGSTGTFSIQNGSTLTAGSSVGTGTIQFAGTGGTLATSGHNFANPISLLANGTINTGSSAETLSGVISGADALTKIGTSTLTLTAANTYTGGTNINAGTLALTGGGMLSTTGAVTIASGATLDVSGVTQAGNGPSGTDEFGSLSGAGTLADGFKGFDVHQAVNGTFSGPITGFGGIQKDGTGTLTLTGTGNYNSVAVQQGTLAVNSTSFNNALVILGETGQSGTFQALSNLTSTNSLLDYSLSTVDTQTYNVTFRTLIDTSGLTKLGAGTLTFTGNNASGSTGYINVNAGTLAVTGTGNLGGVEPLTLGSGTTFDISGATVGETIGALAGAGNVHLGANALTAGDASSTTYSGSISGTGGFTKTGAGTLTLGGTNTFSGGTTINGGTLKLLYSSLLPGAVVDNAVFQLDQAPGQNGGESALISGTGSLLITGGGSSTISHTNTYSGGTTVAAGTLNLGATNALGTGPISLASGTALNMLTFNQVTSNLSGSGSLTSTGGQLSAGGGAFTGTITSTGALSKSTAANLVLDGTSSFSTATVSQGTLAVGDAANPSATLTSPVMVQSGGTLMGHGSITGNVTSLGGTVQPGGTIGTLTVNGNYSQNANSTLAVEVSPTAASLLKVNGSASLAGTLAINQDAGIYSVGTHYPIVTASNGVTGMFATVTQNGANAQNQQGQPVVFDEVYTPNQVQLAVVPFPFPVVHIANPSGGQVLFNEGNLTPNEASVTNAIESILTPASAGAFAQGLVALGTAPGQAGLRTQLAGVLGEARADLATVDLANLTSFNNFLVERMDRRQGLTSTMEVNTGLPGTFDVAQNGSSDMPLFGPSGLIDADAPSLWVHGYGVLGETGGEAGFADFQYQTGGIVAGADLKVTDTSLVGVALAYEHTDLSLNGGGSDSNQIDTYRVSVYGSQKLDPVGVPLTLDAAVGYAFNDYHDNDFLAAGTGFSQTSRHDGNELTAEAGLSQDVHIAQDLVTGALTVVPRVGIEYDNIAQGAYSTTGAANGGLNFAANGSTLNALRSTIGARADLKLTTHDGTVVTPELRASYLHDFMDTNAPLTESFTGAPGAGFRITGVHPGREAALVGTGISAGFSDHLSATIGYDAAVRERELDHTVQVGVKYTW